MFKNLSERLTGIFDKLKSRGSLTETDVDLALREVRVALLEADVSLEVVKEFLEKAKKKAIGSKIVKSVSPAQMVVKIVNDTLKEILGNKEEPINLKSTPPVILLMVGLQGSGKTTTSAKIAKKLKDKDKKKILMSSLDVQRPAAQEQLATLGKQVNVATVEIIKGEKPVKIAERSLEQAKKEGFDVLILDTAGRLQIDDELMNEVKNVSKSVNPSEILLVIGILDVKPNDIVRDLMLRHFPVYLLDVLVAVVVPAALVISNGEFLRELGEASELSIRLGNFLSSRSKEDENINKTTLREPVSLGVRL